MDKSPGIIVDINTLANISAGGKKLSTFELMEIWQKQNILFYKGNQGHKPIRVGKNDGIFVDISRLPKKEIDEIFSKLKTKNLENALIEIKERNSKPYDLSGNK